MGGSSNLPPGVTDSMIPGNTGNDAEWENLFDWMLEEFDGWGPEDVRMAVIMGKAAYEAAGLRQEIPVREDKFSIEDDDLTVVHMHGYHSRDDEVRELKGEINGTADMLLECEEHMSRAPSLGPMGLAVLDKIQTYLRAKGRIPR